MYTLNIYEGETHQELSFIKSNYLNNDNTYIGLLTTNNELWCDLSVNLFPLQNPHEIFINNDMINIANSLENLNLIRATDKHICHGFCSYTLYILSDEFFNEWCKNYD